MAAIIMLIVGAPLLVLGLFMRKGRGLMLLAGYNTMPEAEREKIDKDTLGKTSGNMLIRMGIYFMLMAPAIYLDWNPLFILLIIAVIADPLVTSLRLSRMQMGRGMSPRGTAAVVIIVAVVLVFMGVMFYNGDKDPTVTLQSDTIQIDAMFGTNIPLADVTSITLEEQSTAELIPDAVRTNGYGGFGDVLKGHFRSKELGQFLLYVRAKSAPTIRIELDEGEPVYISLQEDAQTRALYEKLAGAVR